MSTILNLPDIRPSLLLDFANSGRVDPRIQFTRASAATCFGPDGKLRTVAANVPRIDYDPVTGECRGLLVEEQRTNLLTYSEQFDHVPWVKARASVTANATTAPDGTLTADKLVEDTTASDTHHVSANISLTTGTTYCWSAYVKAGERAQVALNFAGTGAFSESKQVRVNLANGSVIETTGTHVGSGVISAGDGWYRVWLAATTTSTAVATTMVYISEGGTTVYSGDGTSGFYVWGAQLEEGAFPTSYIPTTASQVTRAADAASMTGTNFTSWYRQDEGSLIIDYQLGLKLLSSRALKLMSLSPWVNSWIEARSALGNSSGGDMFVVSNGVQQASVPPSVANIAYARYVTALAYKENDFFGVRNGTISAEDTSGTVPEVDGMYIGSAELTSNALCGHIRRIAYYPRRITNEQLQRLTAL